jgi:thiol-disulfide isomerase/thioredoxin
MTVFGYSSLKAGPNACRAMALVVLVASSGCGVLAAARAEGSPKLSVTSSNSGANVSVLAGSGIAAAGLTAGKSLMAKGQYKEAAISLEKAVKASPASAEGQLLLGQAYVKLKTYDKAREHLRLAIRTGSGGASAQKANLALMTLPRHMIAPKSGPGTRLIASMLGLGRSRGGEAKPTVIDFSASWCQPCNNLNAVIAKAKAAYGDKVTFMTVNVDDPGSQTIMDQYDVSPIPTMVFLNPDGEVVTYAVGFSGDDGSVNAGIKKILPQVN